MLLKEQGYVLAIDQASNAAGVSLWFNGKLAATTVLKSHSPKDPFSRRVQWQLRQLDAFLRQYIPDAAVITKVIFEGVRARLVLVTVGAFLACERIAVQLSPRTSFVESTSWKKWAQRHGAVGPLKDIKGVKALLETGFPVEKWSITSDDIADSIMIYSTWRDAE